MTENSQEVTSAKCLENCNVSFKSELGGRGNALQLSDDSEVNSVSLASLEGDSIEWEPLFSKPLWSSFNKKMA